MSAKAAIAAYIAAQTAINDQQDAIIDNLVADQKFQADLITKLQATQDTWTTQDQSDLDALQARSQAQAQKLAALDSLTNPPAPEPPPVTEPSAPVTAPADRTTPAQ